MRELKLVIIVVVLCMFLLFLRFSGSINCGVKNLESVEGYGSVLGQLAPYQKQLNECLSQCERQDPNTRLLPQANINCGRYCESIMTDMAIEGVSPETLPINNEITKCEKQCSAPGASENEKEKCVSMCVGRNNVAKWCKELWCPYSLYDENTCMRQCTSTGNINNNQVSWSWKMSR